MFAVVAACIDRWALCSQRVSVRAFARPWIAVQIIAALIIVWSIIPVHLAIFYSNQTGRCAALAGTYAFTNAIYSVVVIGILPLFLMILFSALAWRNLRTVRNRVLTIGVDARRVRIHQRDHDLLKMLSVEVFIYCVTTIPYPINLIYGVATSSLGASKGAERLAIESLIGYIVSPLLNFMYCCVQFYGKIVVSCADGLVALLVYAYSSNKFRQEFMSVIRCKSIGNHQGDPTNPSMQLYVRK